MKKTSSVQCLHFGGGYCFLQLKKLNSFLTFCRPFNRCSSWPSKKQSKCCLLAKQTRRIPLDTMHKDSQFLVNSPHSNNTNHHISPPAARSQKLKTQPETRRMSGQRVALVIAVALVACLAGRPSVSAQPTGSDPQQAANTTTSTELATNATAANFDTTSTETPTSSAATGSDQTVASSTIAATSLSPDEGTSASEESVSPAAGFYYGLGGAGQDQEQDQEQDQKPAKEQSEAGEAGSEQDLNQLSFGLMNAPHERIQAVQSLLLSSNQQPSRQQLNRNHPPFKSSLSSASSDQKDHQRLGSQTTESPNPNQSQLLNCMHKGRQFAHGQLVPIDEQPCLSCTCRRAVLQCYLRVCPPVISLDSQRRMQQIAAIESGGLPQKCRTIKEPRQCCPSLRCEPALNATSAQATSLKPQTIEAPIEQQAPARVGDHKPPIRVTPTQRPNGQATRDSILLISSNHGNSTSTALATSEPQEAQAHALMEALLETVYASAAGQANGVQLQGACLINGSLYVEGSAVIPEGNALCQYCYCIRQRVMCVRPKCQLIISGCTPRYSNEFACCPTSYSCANQQQTSTGGGHRLTATPTQALGSRLWSALESMGIRLQPAPVQPTEVARSSLEVTSAPLTSSEPMTMRSGERAAAPEADVASKERDEENAEDNEDGADESAEALERRAAAALREEDRALERAMDSIRDRHLSERQAGGDQPPTSTTPSTTTASASTEANATTPTSSGLTAEPDFFSEPMAKLGPMVVSPAAPASCVENNRHYAIGEQIPTLESCKHCYCGLDGLKECEMIECRLKVAHDCRPVVPEGHCCPVRYECPAEQSTDTPTQRHLAPRQRSEDQEQQTATPFSQCKSDTGLGEGCQTVGEPVSETTPTTATEQHQRVTMAAISEELSKFIMQINQSATLPAATPSPQASPDYSLVSAEPQQQFNNVTTTAAAAADYHGVQPPLEEQGGVAPQAQPEEAPMSPGSALEFAGELSTSQPAVGLGNGLGGGGQRDSRSTNSQIFGSMMGEQNGQPFAELNAVSGDPTEPRPLTDDFFTTTSEPKEPTEQSTGGGAANSSSSTVEFDDDNQSHGSTGSGPTSTEASTSDEPSTTGTPLGLEAERTPETNGWLRSLSGIVQSFGRRLSPLGRGEALRSAESDLSSSNETSVLPEQATARSRDARSSLLDHLLRSVIGTGQASSPSTQLVMRPLGAAYSMAEPSTDATLVASGSSAGDTIEIVTAAASADIEPEPLLQVAYSQVENKLAAVDQFAKRSGLMDDEETSSTAQPTVISEMPAPRQRQVLVCFDALANKTYQPNERIPKDDPCKTCTCVLGEELCQTLVCPQRPAESCHEERRAGECCANYICSGNQQPAVTRPQGGASVGASNRNGLATQRAMNVDSDSGSLNSLGQVRANPFQLQLQRQGANDRRLGALPMSSLPQQPIRTSELANYLPAHLRFRPNVGLNQQRGPLIADSGAMDRNRVLFNQMRGSQAIETGARPTQLLAAGWPMLGARRQPAGDPQFGAYNSVRFGQQQARPVMTPVASSSEASQWPPTSELSHRVLFSGGQQQVSSSAFKPMAAPTNLAPQATEVRPQEASSSSQVDATQTGSSEPSNEPGTSTTIATSPAEPQTSTWSIVPASSSGQLTTTTTLSSSIGQETSTQSAVLVTSDEPGAASSDSLPANEDPLASLFRVSECNIYGRLYKVGAAIEELSDVCKKCTCSSMGVDCQSRC